MVSISTLVDRVKIRCLSSGTGPFQLGPAVPAYRGVEALTDGVTYSYAVEEGANFEAGTGLYLASSQTLVRSPQISSRDGVAVSFGVNAQINFVALAQDIIATGATIPVVQTTGSSETSIMSQKAVTDALNMKLDGGGVDSLSNVLAVLSLINGAILQADETISEGSFVNLFVSGGTTRMRNAIASDPLKFASAFVPAAIDSGEYGQCIFSGLNLAAIVTTPADQVWLSDVTPGGFRYTAPDTEGTLVQPLGPAIVNFGIVFSARERILL